MNKTQHKTQGGVEKGNGPSHMETRTFQAPVVAKALFRDTCHQYFLFDGVLSCRRDDGATLWWPPNPTRALSMAGFHLGSIIRSMLAALEAAPSPPAALANENSVYLASRPGRSCCRSIEP